VIPVSAPPRLAAHLRSAVDGPAPVLHRGPDAVYVAVAGRCVGVVGTRATAVPCSLRTALPSLPDVTVASVRDGALRLDDEPLVIGRLVDVSVPRLHTVAEVRRAPAGPVLRCEPASLVGSLEAPDVATLVGRGDGLTPYGDDVLCGWLAVHRAAGVPTPEVDAAVLALAPTTTLLSATLLDCAMHGEVIPEFAAWLAALRTEAERAAAEALSRVGHTSGRGLLEGARRALAALESVATRSSTSAITPTRPAARTR
jgi:hypothetical protein